MNPRIHQLMWVGIGLGGLLVLVTIYQMRHNQRLRRLASALAFSNPNQRTLYFSDIATAGQFTHQRLSENDTPGQAPIPTGIPKDEEEGAGTELTSMLRTEEPYIPSHLQLQSQAIHFTDFATDKDGKKKKNAVTPALGTWDELNESNPWVVTDRSDRDQSQAGRGSNNDDGQWEVISTHRSGGGLTARSGRTGGDGRRTARELLAENPSPRDDRPAEDQGNAPTRPANVPALNLKRWENLPEEEKDGWEGLGVTLDSAKRGPNVDQCETAIPSPRDDEASSHLGESARALRNIPTLS